MFIVYVNVGAQNVLPVAIEEKKKQSLNMAEDYSQSAVRISGCQIGKSRHKITWFSEVNTTIFSASSWNLVFHSKQNFFANQSCSEIFSCFPCKWLKYYVEIINLINLKSVRQQKYVTHQKKFKKFQDCIFTAMNNIIKRKKEMSLNSIRADFV